MSTPDEQRPSSISFSRSLSNPSRDRFKGMPDRCGSSLDDRLLTYCIHLLFLLQREPIPGHPRCLEGEPQRART
jgi:hypothetical protein